jgi:chlorobactene glucosyltransferase
MNALLQHQIGIVVFLAASLCICVTNWKSLRRLESSSGNVEAPSGDWPQVSILVAARDEAHNIEACVHSLLEQDYAKFELLVLDDESSDGSFEILQEISRHNPRLTVLCGAPLPPGWVGKQWACHQLACRATGELLLFTDADTRHHPHTLRRAVRALHDQQADLLSVLPVQEIGSAGELLVVPLLYWSLMAFIPLWAAFRWRASGLSFSIGQFLLFRKTAYEAVGGFERVRHNYADDLAITREVKRQGLTWRLMDGSSLVRCRMYRGLREAFHGISKNLLAAFDFRLLPYLFVWCWIAVAFLEPPVVAVLGLKAGLLRVENVWLAYTGSVLAVFTWLLMAVRFRYPRWLALVYPAVVLTAVSAAGRSLWLSLAGRVTWKERTLPPAKIRLW